MAEPQRRQRSLEEAKAASALQHPGIVLVHDVVEAGGQVFIVTEYVSGETLEHRQVVFNAASITGNVLIGQLPPD